MFRSRVFNGALAAFLATVFAAAVNGARAQDYPARAVRLVTMFAAGSATDFRARFMSQKLTEQLGQTVILENKGGASGLIATQDVLRAQPPGYSLLYGSNMLSGNLYAFKDPQYKLEDFTVVGVLGMTPFALITHRVPANTLAEFIAHAKANPGKLNYGSLGPTSGQTLLAERLKFATGISMVGIPFKGGDPMAQAFMAGDIQLYFATLNTALERMKNAETRGLATAAEQRSRLLPSLPTFRELGFPSITMIQWDAIFVPVTVPRPIVQRLQTAINNINASAEMKDYLQKLEREPWPGSIDQFITYMKSEGAQMGADMKRMNITVLD